MDLVWIVNGLFMILFAVVGYLYKELKSKTDDNQKDFLNYKTHVSEVYATQPQLTRAIDAVSKTIEGVVQGVARIESRLYEQRN